MQLAFTATEGVVVGEAECYGIDPASVRVHHCQAQIAVRIPVHRVCEADLQT
ncbi:hypothetical protein OG524_02655 [Streptomyces sp. NBC_01520]|uniref:hypothetical protein n=1 Tax=Streptomyces sp. NBC_01520 TaxID=2903892 RepID=UPI00386921A8